MSSNSRVILINSNNHAFQAAMPLGLMALATYLRQDHGLGVDIVDLPLEERGKEPDFDEFCRGLNFADLLFVGCSTMCNTLPRTLSVALHIKTTHPLVPLVLGGPQATSVATGLLRNYAFIDCVVAGEAEAVVDHLVECLKSKIRKSVPGVVWNRSDDSSCTANELGECSTTAVVAPLVNIDHIRPIDYDVYPPARADKGVMLDVGRGCPYGCTFCSTADFFRRRFRLKSPSKIADEVTRVISLRNPQRVDFVHDMFTVDRKLVTEVCSELVQRRVRIQWGCSARTDSVDEGLLELMSDAGCNDIFYGIETGSARIQKIIGKNLDLKDAELRIAQSKKLGMRVTASLIIGFPQEEESDCIETINFVLKLRAIRPRLGSVQTHLLSPLAGTAITQSHLTHMKYDGYISDITSVANLTAWEQQEILRLPDVFSSFYYLHNNRVARATYKYIHWMLFFGNRFDNAYKLLWDAVGTRLGELLFARALRGGAWVSSLRHTSSAHSLPAIALELRGLLSDSELSAIESRRIEDAIRFDLWKSDEIVQEQDQPVFISAYNYVEREKGGGVCVDSSPSDRYLHYLERTTGRLTVIRVPIDCALLSS